VDARLPVVLLHGSPGDAASLAALGERLAADGRRVLALDLPGFGASVDAPGGRSISAHAAAVLEAVPWPEFHVAAWSMGGGVALHLAERAPERVRSLALVASIGVQEAEGSGSHAFEHVKYAANALACLGFAELVPHFGLFGTRGERLGYVRNFWESDQRPLRGILASLSAPLLLAHGREDFLVPLWCAEESHALVPGSRLVILEGGHFLPLAAPYGALAQLAPELEAFLARHDVPGVPEPRARVELDPGAPRTLPPPFLLPRLAPWWAWFAGGALLAALTGAWSGFVLGALCAFLQLDFGLALIAAACGLLVPARRGRPRALGVLGVRGVLGTLGSWARGALRLLAAFLASAAFVAAAGERLCRPAGPVVGVVLGVLLPILAALALVRLARARRRPHVPA
jgi:pimeloyl-ACP methyl ester carboxylesterase